MSTLDQQRLSLLGLDREAFHRRGYTIVRGLLEAGEAEELRGRVSETFAEMERQGRVGTDPGSEGTIKGMGGDLLSIPSLRHVLLDPRILRVISELLGGQPVYFGDSSVRVGANGQRAWHRDNVNRRKWRGGPDWHGIYPLLRCGLYLQDHAHHSGGLALRPRSNDAGRPLPTFAKLVDTKAGDLVVWNLRTLHSGEVVRMRGLPMLPLHPKVQSLLPTRLRVPAEQQRIVLFMGFALAGPHLDNYLAYLRTRDYMLAAWEKSRFSQDVWEEAERAGLCMLRPLPAYGTP